MWVSSWMEDGDRRGKGKLVRGAGSCGDLCGWVRPAILNRSSQQKKFFKTVISGFAVVNES